MSDIKLDCPSSVKLTEAEIEWLDSVPDAAHDVPGSAWCELEDRHPGRHVALAQSEDAGDLDDPRVNYWIWWDGDDGAHEVTNGGSCEVRRAGPESDLCLLPSDHVGRDLF